MNLSRINRFITDVAQPHVVSGVTSAAYARMVADEVREIEAEEWDGGAATGYGRRSGGVRMGNVNLSLGGENR
jgi:hypothetical protein